jgi:predicted N-acetyltransferase YhbS
MGVEIEVLRDRDVTEDVVKAFERLLPQLSRSAPALDAPALRELVAFAGNRMLIARVDGEIVGTLTLVMFPIPTGLRAWIEDVVVDSAARGQGVGAALTREAVRLAEAAGARTVDLTSRPSREAALRAARLPAARLEGLPLRRPGGMGQLTYSASRSRRRNSSSRRRRSASHFFIIDSSSRREVARLRRNSGSSSGAR